VVVSLVAKGGEIVIEKGGAPSFSDQQSCGGGGLAAVATPRQGPGAGHRNGSWVNGRPRQRSWRASGAQTVLGDYGMLWVGERCKRGTR
jgi:hypothetical protein